MVTLFVEAAELVQVERLQLAQESTAFVVGEAVPPGEDVLLTVIMQALTKVRGNRDHATNLLAVCGLAGAGQAASGVRYQTSTHHTPVRRRAAAGRSSPRVPAHGSCASDTPAPA